MIGLEVKYELGHTRNEEWEKTAHHCPACGVKEVWEEQDAGDYYVGVQYLCASCGAGFYLPHGCEKAEGWQNEQRLAAIRAAQ